ncbi:MFS transporter [Thermotoga sp. Ku-13t]|uniref:MFS transporter n=1 Tax=Thermotoga sp. Ku-13t TaxID=1755813 RepID=UPI0013ECF513|nr:MFS transporter [Thermotoga sp. Ku-13t]KAF2957136.1 MFS transporter [Thermotoga sp. Ku-13t]
MRSLDDVIEMYVPMEYKRKMLLLTSILWMYDAAGVLVLSFTLPSISEAWKLSIAQSANLLSATFIGMLLGALSVGSLSDALGRRLSNLLYFLLTFFPTAMLGLSRGFGPFFLLRLISGIGYGGLMPSVNAYLAEFMGKSFRGAFLVLLEASWAIGSIAIGLISVLTISYSWRISYLVFLSGALLVPILLKLPESPRFAFKKGGKPSLEKILKTKIEEEIQPLREAKVTVVEILKGPQARKTLMIWTVWFTVSFVYYVLFSWAPKIFAQHGLTVTRSLWFTFFMMVAQLPGYLSAAYFIEKIGRKRSLQVYLAGIAVSSILWAFVSSTFQLVSVALLLSFFTLGVWGLVYAYTPEIYPTTMRATGNGMAGVVARIAGILAPQYGGFMLQRNASFLEIFSWLALLSMFAAVIVSLFAVETKQQDIT